MTLDFLVEEGLTDFQKALQRALSNLPTGTERADVARLRSSLREVLALLNYELANDHVSGLPDDIEDPRVVAARNGFEIIHLHLPRLRASVERPAVERVMRQHPQSMVIATSSDPSDEGAWHFVNVKDAGQGRKMLRRAVLEPPSVGRTVLETLSQCQVQASQSALDIEIAHDRAFDVEAVSKRFYIEYARQFEQLRDEVQTIHGVSKEKADGSVQELLNRLIFLMFIQRKSWLPTPENPDRNFLWTEFTQSHRADPSANSYHADFLQPLFLALSRRKESHARRGIAAEVKQVPFLNGGLFDLDDDSDVLTLPNSAFEGLFKNLLLHYNFTIREDTPLEVEVAIDPEMLGQVFERLVLQVEKTGELDPRKATGSYYTPREIVHFMCQQALKEWITGQEVLGPEALDGLFGILRSERTGPEEREQLPGILSEGDAERLRERLLDVAVVDPAVGSGAFLVGMLHELLAMVRLLDLLLPGQKEIDRRNYDYEQKQRIIERCLYGVDIQPRAVRICELRLWLSLVVDYELAPGDPPPTLPNLTYRVMAGDSLIEHLLGRDVRWPGEPWSDRERQLVDGIQAEKDAHFFTDDPQKKRSLDASITRHIAELAREILSRKNRETQMELGATITVTGPDPILTDIDSVIRAADKMSRAARLTPEDVSLLRTGAQSTFVWRLNFAEVFRRHGGFNIVIGNPPWGIPIADSDKSYFRKHYRVARGRIDTFALFIDKSISLLAPNGCLAMILPDILLLKNYPATRKLILEESKLRWIVFWGMAFGDVNLDTCTVVLAREPDAGKRAASMVRVMSEPAGELALETPGLIQQATFERNEQYKFNIYLSPEIEALIDKIDEACVPFGHLFEIHEGIHSGNIRDKLFHTNVHAPSARPLIFGRDEIGRYRLNWGGRFVSYDPGIIDKAAGEYANLGDERYFTAEKILVRRTGDYLVAARDAEGFCVSNNLFLCLPLGAAVSNLDYYVAVLNSSLVTWYFRAIQPRVGRLFAELKIVHLRRLPVPQLDASMMTAATELAAALAANGEDPASCGPFQERFDELLLEALSLDHREVSLVVGGARPPGD